MANQSTPVIQIKDSNVGIGTTSPTRKLQITDGEVYVRFNPTTVAGTYILGAADGRFYVIPESTFVPTMTFNSGNVLIGTTTDNGYRLNVSGITNVSAGAITAGSETTYAFRVLQGKPLTLGADDNYAYIQSWSSGPLSINSQGNNVLFPNSSTIVSIGTANPYSGMSTKLYVGYPQDSTVNNADQFISVGAGGGSTNKAGINFLIYSAGYGARIYTEDITPIGLGFDVLQVGTFYNAMNITRTTSPNVLIGTTTDSGARLSIDGGAGMTAGWQRSLYISATYPGIVMRSGAGGNSFVAHQWDSGSNYIFNMGSNSDTPNNGVVYAVNASTRNMMIGTTTDPGYKLFVSGGSLGVNIGTASNNQAAAQFVDSARGLTYMPTVAGSAYNWASVTNGSALFNTINSDWWVGNHDGSALRFVQNSSLVFYTNSGIRGAWTGTGLGIASSNPTTRIDAYGNPNATNGVIQATPTYGGGSYFTAFRAVPSDTGDQGNYKGLFMGSISSDNALITSGSVYNSAGLYLPGGTTSTGIGMGGGTFTIFGNTGLTAGTEFYPTTRMTVVGSTGNVLIGTTTDAGYKLNVNGTFLSQGTAYFSGNVNFSNQYRTYGLPYFEMGGGGISDEYLLLVPRYVSGFYDPYLLMGELQFQRGSTGTGNDNSITTISIQTAYNQTNFYQFSINGATVWTSIDIISISGVQWFALKARTNGGGPYLVNQFVGNLTDSGSQMLTRVRLSDAGVALVTANVYLPSYTNYGGFIIRGTSYDSPYFALKGDEYTLVEIADRTSGTTDVGFIGIYSENTKVIDIPGNADKVYFNNGGNFLIGTTTDNGAKLNVNGTSYISGAASFGSTIDVNGNVTLTQDTNDLIFQQTNSSSHGIVWKNTSYTKDSASIRPTGNGAWATQGIGFYTVNTGDSTTAPTIRFNIEAGGNITMFGAYNHLKFDNWSDDNNYIQQTKPDGTVVGYTGFDGYSTPSAYYTDYVVFTRPNGGSLTRRIYVSSTGAMSLQDATGNVLIGTTADNGAKLEVAGPLGGTIGIGGSTLRLTNTDTGNYSSITAGITGLTNSGMQFSTDGTRRAVISSAGNFIIGSGNDAGYMLDVYGEILGRDDIRITNTFALVFNGTDNNWRMGRNTITDSGWLTGQTLQVVVFGGQSGQGFQVVNTNGTALFEIDGVAGASRFTNALGVGVNPSGTAGRIDASNDIVAYSSSDLRLKENIKPIENSLDKVKALTGVEFDWKAEHKEAHGYEGHDTGVIAQEVQEVMPTAVRTNDTGYLAVRYEKLIGLLIEANKELANRVEHLESKLK